MEIVLTNGTCFIKVGDNGKIIKTPEINEADVFNEYEDAIKIIEKASIEYRKKYYPADIKDTKHSVRRKYRKFYSQDQRKIVYKNSGCRCVLCGQKIKFEDMSLDHIIPLSMGGADNIENLQSTCLPCNQFKSNSLPEDFIDRLTTVFMYQMEQKHKSDLSWKMKRMLLKMMI